jgi:hypothetical protein
MRCVDDSLLRQGTKCLSIGSRGGQPQVQTGGERDVKHQLPS